MESSMAPARDEMRVHSRRLQHMKKRPGAEIHQFHSTIAIPSTSIASERQPNKKLKARLTPTVLQAPGP